MATVPSHDLRRVIVLAGGDPVGAALAERLPNATEVIAADSGLANAAGLGLTVDLVVGDLDSVSPAALQQATANGTRVERHPAAKDRTDLALALDAALQRGPARVTVVGGHGGRLDHFLGNLLLLAADAYAPLTIEAFMGAAHVHVVRRRSELAGVRGELVTLLPAHGPATGVTTDGLLYPLTGETLEPGSTRGVSNELTGPRASVSLAGGVLLAVQPGALGTHVRSRIGTEPDDRNH